jgi:hypothetical protein
MEFAAPAANQQQKFFRWLKSPEPQQAANGDIASAAPSRCFALFLNSSMSFVP